MRKGQGMKEKKFGYFDNEKKEYVITTPKTPYPWINYLGNERFFSLISNTSGGYSFYRDARKRRITRYRYNDVPVDSIGKYFYIRDKKTVWSPAWKPAKTELDWYECRHGMGYTSIAGRKNDLKAECLWFVPLGMDCEAVKVTISNEGTEKKEFSLFSLVEFCLWEAMDDMTNFQRNFSTGETEFENHAIYHKTEYRERRNHYAYYWCSRDVQGYDMDRDSFLGAYRGYELPEAVEEGKCRNSGADGWSPIAVHQLDLKLEAQEKQEIIFVLGYVENEENEKWESSSVINKQKALQQQSKIATPEQFDKAFAELRIYWENLLGRYVLECEDRRLETMVNIWNQYQCMVTFNLSRSASYFESGIGRGMGFRDSNQDLLGFVHQIPDRAKERILDIAATQRSDGSAFHQYQPLTKKGNADIGGGFQDDPLWLILAVDAYIRETGDWKILEAEAGFDDKPEGNYTLSDHLRASFMYVGSRLGPHGLPLIGRADWNDCLNLNCFSHSPDDSFQTCENVTGGAAESVMIAGLFVYAGRQYISILRHSGRDKEAAEAESAVRKMSGAIREYGYDGEWFLRAYDYFGHKVGSHECGEGKIYIEPQGFCVMAGIGVEDGTAKKALDSVETYLESEYGIALVAPAYSRYHEELGEISSYPQGYKENGGIFCHSNPWIAIANTVIGDGDRAFRVYRKIAPSYLQDIQELHKVEPYVYSQMVAGQEAARHGEGKNSWLTGTAAWNYVAITQYILGIRPDYEGLCIDPCIPGEMKEYRVKRTFRGNTYRITVRNPKSVCKGIHRLYLDGKELTGNLIPYTADGKEHEVEVILG